MDMVSHLLWVYVLFREKEWLRKGLFFAVLPDIGYFFIMVYIIFHPSGAEAAIPDYLMTAYFIPHSFVTLGFVAAAAWKLKPDLLPALSAWAVHICMDIPSHSGGFATQYLYPILPNTVEGVSWSDYRVVFTSYFLFSIVYAYSLWRENKKHRLGAGRRADWLDRLNRTAGNIINKKPSTTVSATSRDISRAFEKVFGKNRVGAGQGQDKPAGPLPSQEAG